MSLLCMSWDCCVDRSITTPCLVRNATSSSIRTFMLLAELWPNLGDGGLREAAYRGG